MTPLVNLYQLLRHPVLATFCALIPYDPPSPYLVYTPVISCLDYAPYLFCLGLCTLKLLFQVGCFIHPHFIWVYHLLIYLGFLFYTPSFRLGLPPVIPFGVPTRRYLGYVPIILFDYTPVNFIWVFTLPSSPIWVYIPIIFHLGLRTCYLLWWVYSPYILHLGCTLNFYLGLPPAIFYLGLPLAAHPYLVSGFTHPLFLIWAYTPIIFCLGFTNPLSFIWVYAPRSLLSPTYSKRSPCGVRAVRGQS